MPLALLRRKDNTLVLAAFSFELLRLILVTILMFLTLAFLVPGWAAAESF
jgi:hypothetical protein